MAYYPTQYQADCFFFEPIQCTKKKRKSSQGQPNYFPCRKAFVPPKIKTSQKSHNEVQFQILVHRSTEKIDFDLIEQSPYSLLYFFSKYSPITADGLPDPGFWTYYSIYKRQKIIVISVCLKR